MKDVKYIDSALLFKVCAKAGLAGRSAWWGEIELSWDELATYKLHYAIIFTHDFAKAFWGEKKTDFSCGCDSWSGGCPRCHNEYEWQYHLQQMVLEPEPLKYLEQFLTKEVR